ncbi:MAG: hypothetical protein HC865_20405 [Cyanobacteria bacterium RU_5_0]|nr:hypothetical protein [Cyanobacteria bacterium RU_5_0]
MSKITISDLSSVGSSTSSSELSLNEQRQVNGGLIGAILVGGLFLLASCAHEKGCQPKTEPQHP